MFVLIWATLLFSVRGNNAVTGAAVREHCVDGFCITLSEGEITAEAGLCVVIPCSFTTASVFTPQHMVWHKCEPYHRRCDDSDVIFHTNKNNDKVQSGFKGRVSLLEPDVSQKNCSIIINDLTESDSGLYQLRVNGFYTGFTFTTKANVSVKGLTQKPTVMIPPLTEGQQTTLTCTAPGLCSGSDPNITWTWRGAGEKDSHITGNITAVHTEDLTAVTQRHSSTLTFNPSAEQHGTDVTCKVSFANNITTEETVTLNVSSFQSTELVPQLGVIISILIVVLVVGLAVVVVLHSTVRWRFTKCHRKNQKISRNPEETLEMVPSQEAPLSVEVTSEVLMEMNRSDLVKRLSDFSSGSKGPSGSLELEGCGSINKDSGDWTKLEPEVNSTGADEAPTYSLQSEAGHFECSVSGLRWICEGKVRFKYQFSSVEEHMERIKSMQYMPAGPLMNIKVLAGKLDEVHLSHWICIDDNPTILDKFAVLHIDDCGDVVEKVSEVTSSHVKLCEPVFSLKMPLVRYSFSVKVRCNVLIYKINTASLTLNVYLIPRDPGLQQELDKGYKYRVIQKPYPEKSLKMKDRFILTTDLDGAEINPERLKLRNENPNFFEVFIDNPDTNFKLKLTKANKRQPVWTCAIKNDQYQSIGHVQEREIGEQSSNAGSSDTVRPSAGAGGGCTGADFVDKHRVELIDRVSNIASILDELLNKKIITQGAYNKILANPDSSDWMRKLYSGPLHSAGPEGKEVFYKILEKEEPFLVADLKKKK